MNQLRTSKYSALFVFIIGCAGTKQPAESQSSSPPAEEPWEAIEPEESTLSSKERADTPEGADEESVAAPDFRPGMSVAEATNAVPDSIERLNIEQEALAAPLMEPELYEPCGLEGHHHFTLRVAVWDGRAVGLDVSTQPNDQKLETCLRQQISEVEWKEKAKSINTVEYNY